MKTLYIVIDYNDSQSSWICDSQESVRESISLEDDDNIDQQSWDEFLAKVSESDIYDIIEISGTAKWLVSVNSIGFSGLFENILDNLDSDSL